MPRLWTLTWINAAKHFYLIMHERIFPQIRFILHWKRGLACFIRIRHGIKTHQEPDPRRATTGQVSPKTCRSVGFLWFPTSADKPSIRHAALRKHLFPRTTAKQNNVNGKLRSAYSHGYCKLHSQLLDAIEFDDEAVAPLRALKNNNTGCGGFLLRGGKLEQLVWPQAVQVQAATFRKKKSYRAL